MTDLKNLGKNKDEIKNLDAIISAHNQSLFLWEVGPSAAHLERETKGGFVSYLE